MRRGHELHVDHAQRHHLVVVRQLVLQLRGWWARPACRARTAATSASTRPATRGQLRRVRRGLRRGHGLRVGVVRVPDGPVGLQRALRRHVGRHVQLRLLRALVRGGRALHRRACGPPPPRGGTNATDHDCRTAGVVGMRFVRVPPGGSAGDDLGTDVYTHDSSICTAAVHAGRITFASGGTVTIEMRAGAATHTSTARNGVTSNPYGSWYCSYAIP